MGRLEVTFKIGLAYPLLLVRQPVTSPLVVNFSDTGNTVHLDPPERVPPTVHQAGLGALDHLTLRVRREPQEQIRDPLSDFGRLRILSDAAKAFWMFFEIIREFDFRENNSLPGYPVAPADELRENALLRSCDIEWSFDGNPQGLIPLGSVPMIRITENAWEHARRKLSAQEKILPHVSFALDAAYFARRDPIRAVVMACAAWETALRYYLANVASAIDPAYMVASKGGSLPRLYEFMKAAKGGDLFHQDYGKGSDEFYDRQRDSVCRLPTLRNKLLHEGAAAIPEGVALDAVLSVLNATEWLFAGGSIP